MPEGEPAKEVVEDPTEQPIEALGSPDFVAQYAEDYLPDASRPDDYRCFPLDARFPEETFVRATRVVPGELSLVHHVLVYVVAPDDVEVAKSGWARNGVASVSACVPAAPGRLGSDVAAQWQTLVLAVAWKLRPSAGAERKAADQESSRAEHD